MTSQGPRKPVDDGHSAARLVQAREFHESARSLVTLAQSKSYNPAITLGNRLPDKQEKFYRRLLGRKDEVNYGARSTTLAEAERLMAELDEFATWAEGSL